MYLSEHALKEIPAVPRIMLGIQGPPGSGKTASALTFPNPIIAEFDNSDYNGLLKLDHLRDVKPQIIPFYSQSFIVDTLKIPPNRSHIILRHKAFQDWLFEHGPKLTPDQTLIVNTWSFLQDVIDAFIFCKAEEVFGRDGKRDDFAPWDNKIEHSKQILNALKDLSCNVVITFHESLERDKNTGLMLDKTQPLQQGKFVTRIKGFFPSFYKSIVRQKFDANGKPIEGQKPEYLWQTASDNKFDAKNSRPDLPMLVPATYKSLVGDTPK